MKSIASPFVAFRLGPFRFVPHGSHVLGVFLLSLIPASVSHPCICLSTSVCLYIPVSCVSCLPLCLSRDLLLLRRHFQKEVGFGYGTMAERWAGVIREDEDTGYGGLPPGTEVQYG